MAQSSHVPVVGIDLGTTYSVVSHLDAQGRPASVLNAEGDVTTPSVVFLDQAGVVVGKEAVHAAEFEPDRVARYPKRYMGQKEYPHLVRGEHWQPEVLQAAILRKLKLDAEQKLGPLERAVVTVPAYFNEPRRKATQDAGRMAGWDVIDILNEPTAAAIAFGVTEGFVNPGVANPQPQVVLVYDLGGGTFDVTAMRIERNRFTVLATAGDVALGGIDWDGRIIDYVASECVKQYQADPRQDPAALERLRTEAEAAKRSLSARTSTHVPLTWNAIKMRVPLLRTQFEEMTGDLLERTRLTVRRLVKDAKLTYADISRVLLVGGSTRMPMVAAMLEHETGKPPDRSLAPDEAVAHGAAIYASALAGHFEGEGLHVVNVNAHDLGVMGIEKSTGMPRRFTMIRRNSPLPAEAATKFKTPPMKAKSGGIRVVEGGDDSGNGATPIGLCVVTDLPKAKDGHDITVMFHYGANGRLAVTAQTATGKAATLIVERASGMPEDQLAAWTERVSAGLIPDQATVEEQILDLPELDDNVPEASNEETPHDDDASAGGDSSKDLPPGGKNPFDFSGWGA